MGLAICDTDHDEVCYDDEGSCPVCELKDSDDYIEWDEHRDDFKRYMDNKDLIDDLLRDIRRARTLADCQVRTATLQILEEHTTIVEMMERICTASSKGPRTLFAQLQNEAYTMFGDALFDREWKTRTPPPPPPPSPVPNPPVPPANRDVDEIVQLMEEPRADLRKTPNPPSPE